MFCILAKIIKSKVWKLEKNQLIWKHYWYKKSRKKVNWSIIRSNGKNSIRRIYLVTIIKRKKWKIILEKRKIVARYLGKPIINKIALIKNTNIRRSKIKNVKRTLKLIRKLDQSL